MTDTTAMVRLATGDVRVLGRLPRSSNYTFLAVVLPGSSPAPRPTSPAVAPGPAESAPAFSAPRALPEELFGEVPSGSVPVVYKPGGGERPLWDFPDGLYKREVAAYRLCCALGWDFVPETVERADAPLGAGSLQRFVDADFDITYFDLAEQSKYHEALVTIAAFDILVNNTDRKAGHILCDGDGRLWAIDNGLSFHESPKLRTVIWDFGGELLPGDVCTALAHVAQCDPLVVTPLQPLLSTGEIKALAERAGRLIERGRLPEVPEQSRPYPWPLV